MASKNDKDPQSLRRDAQRAHRIDETRDAILYTQRFLDRLSDRESVSRQHVQNYLDDLERRLAALQAENKGPNAS